MKLHGAGQPALPAIALATFSGVPLQLAAFTPGITEQTAAFKKLSPSGKQPIIIHGETVVTDDVAVLKQVAAGTLYPEGDIRSKIDDWFATSAKLAAVVSQWLLADAKERSVPEAAALQILASAEAAAGQTTHLAGDQLTAADITIAASTAGFFFCGFTETVQKQLPNLTALFTSLFSDSKFQALLGGLQSYTPGATEPPAFLQVVAPEWTTERTRSAFIEFFEVRHGHPFWHSSPVVPVNDPTLLFTNAGMNQYKAIFLGTADPATPLGQLTRAANSQKCIRAGGKHNDLDDVGKDVYHHTFFEMLGNWSFGDYFKDEAIAYAWELLTDVYSLDPSRLYATYFEGDPSANLPPDEEARQLWLRFLPAEQIIPGNKKDNFWEMGDQGPCGPCTEIHYDRIGGRLVPELVNMDDPNVLEIWNVVFIQFNREASGELLELPAKHVDTGMGLERISSVLVDKLSNYATDAFGPLFDAIQAATKARPYSDKVGEEDSDGLDMAYRVVADHIRTLSFAIADGAAPGAEGRDYVLRRVLRRAVRYGDKLGGKLGFFSELVRPLVQQMGYFYPELVAKEEHIRKTIQIEETAFGKTLRTGAQVFNKKTAGLAKGGVLDGAVIFELYDAYGYPVDLTELMAEEVGLKCDMEGFEKAMAAAKAKSRASGRAAAADALKFEAHATAWLKDHNIPITDDEPKFNVRQDVEAKVMAIMTAKGFVDSAGHSEDVVGLVLDTTSFYAESGGQVTDTGTLELQDGGELAVTTCAVAASYVLHMGTLSGTVTVGHTVKCCVDWQRRALITPNHTMTHVLNLALRNVCGDHIDQKGSIVLPEKLSFDFSNNGPVSVEHLKHVQEACQKSVKAAHSVFTKVVPLADAHKIHGLRAVFGEAYPDPVRVVSVGKSVDELLADPDNKENYQFSVEFCGGTHMRSTSEARNFAIVQETAVAQGVRRILAVTADRAEQAFQNAEALANEAAAFEAQSEPDEAAVKALVDRIDRDESLPAPSRAEIKTQVEGIVKKVLAVKKAKVAEAAKSAKDTAVNAASEAVSAGAKHLVLQLNLPASVSGKAMPEAYTAIKAEHPGLPCLLLAPDADAGKCSVYTEVPKDVSKVLSASEWLKCTVGTMGGKGGGKPERAAGSGPDVSKVAEAVKAANAFAISCLAAES